MSSNFQDSKVDSTQIDDSLGAAPQYPMIYWYGNQQQQVPKFPVGAFQISPQQIELPDEKLHNITGFDGSIRQSYLFKTLHVALIGKISDEWVEYEGRKSRQVRAFCFVKELMDLGFTEPVVISIRNFNGGEFINAANSFKPYPALAGELAGRKYTFFEFWMPLVGAESMKSVGKNQKSNIRPVSIDKATYPLDVKSLEKLFVGDELKTLFIKAVPEQIDWHAEQGQTDTAPTVESDEDSFNKNPEAPVEEEEKTEMPF